MPRDIFNVKPEIVPRKKLTNLLCALNTEWNKARTNPNFTKHRMIILDMLHIYTHIHIQTSTGITR